VNRPRQHGSRYHSGQSFAPQTAESAPEMRYPRKKKHECHMPTPIAPLIEHRQSLPQSPANIAGSGGGWAAHSGHLEGFSRPDQRSPTGTPDAAPQAAHLTPVGPYAPPFCRSTDLTSIRVVINASGTSDTVGSTVALERGREARSTPSHAAHQPGSPAGRRTWPATTRPCAPAKGPLRSIPRPRRL